MQLTHYGHSCLLVELAGTRVLVDPGTFSTGWTELTGLDAVLVTHQHADHLDTGALPELLAANPDVPRYCDPATAEREGAPWRALCVGEPVQLGAVTVHVQGGAHAVIHPDVPVVDNVALVFGTADHPALLLHPGDSFHVPPQGVDVLALPTAAPWLKLAEAVDYLRAVAPRVAVPIHEAVLAMPQLHYGLFTQLAPEATEVRVLERGVPTPI